MTRRYRVQLPQAEPYRPDHRAVAKETLTDHVLAFLVLVTWLAILIYVLPILGEAAK